MELIKVIVFLNRGTTSNTPGLVNWPLTLEIPENTCLHLPLLLFYERATVFVKVLCLTHLINSKNCIFVFI